MNEALSGALGALGLGLLGAVHPCPLGTHLAALSLICGWTRGVRRTLAMGLAFTCGVIFSYVLLGVLLAQSALLAPDVANFLQHYLNRLLGPLLILAGMLLAGLLRVRERPLFLQAVSSRLRSTEWNLGSAFLLGMALALSFCPATAALFFGVLVPLAVADGFGLLYPLLYGVGAGLPLLAVVALAAQGADFSGPASKGRGSRARRLPRFAGCALIVIGVLHTLRHVYRLI